MLTTCGILKRLASALLWKIWKHLDILTLRTEKTEHVDGGLLFSVEVWKGLRELRGSREKVRADERILGGSEFVERVLRVVDDILDMFSCAGEMRSAKCFAVP